VASAVAPASSELGVMLAYSPLHHLLLADVAQAAGEQVALVVTSGNVSDEPIAFRDEDALNRLAVIAEMFLVHDRAIQTRTDDSVVRALDVAGRSVSTFLRRSRGYVPNAIKLAEQATMPVLACGAELKSTFCLARGERAWISHHIGDLENYETLVSFTEGIAHFERLFGVEPQIVAHDLHPEYLSTKYAREREGVELIGVQHHHAHLAACLAEHAEPGPAIGAIFDGTGYGADGTVWGGEILHGDLEGFQRMGSLPAVRLPGGRRAIREPWRMACAWLDAARDDDAGLPWPLSSLVEASAYEQMRQLVRSGISSPQTTSMGRLFDAVAAMCGIRTRVNYEGQAAVELEAACREETEDAYPFELARAQEGMLLDVRPTITALLDELARGADVGVVSSRFHATIASLTAEACLQAACANDVDLVVLSGGVFQNRRLIEQTSYRLTGAGLRVLVPQLLPANDGGIAFGQAAVAARLSARPRTPGTDRRSESE
jgi:hydrogenase maturation protein HypF